MKTESKPLFYNKRKHQPNIHLQNVEVVDTRATYDPLLTIITLQNKANPFINIHNNKWDLLRLMDGVWRLELETSIGFKITYECNGLKPRSNVDPMLNEWLAFGCTYLDRTMSKKDRTTYIIRTNCGKTIYLLDNLPGIGPKGYVNINVDTQQGKLGYGWMEHDLYWHSLLYYHSKNYVNWYINQNKILQHKEEILVGAVYNTIEMQKEY